MNDNRQTGEILRERVNMNRPFEMIYMACIVFAECNDTDDSGSKDLFGPC